MRHDTWAYRYHVEEQPGRILTSSEPNVNVIRSLIKKKQVVHVFIVSPRRFIWIVPTRPCAFRTPQGVLYKSAVHREGSQLRSY